MSAYVEKVPVFIAESNHPHGKWQELSYRKEIARKLRTQYVEGI